MTRIYVLSGGPGTGKTSVIQELRKKGYRVFTEIARKVANENKKFIGKSIKEINQEEFQKAIFKEQIIQLNEIKKIKEDHPIFLDRGFFDTIAYYKVHNLEIPEEELFYAKKIKYSKIFILDILWDIKKDGLRNETKEEQKKIQEIIIKTCKEMGSEIVIVPRMKVKKRMRFILDKIKSD